MTDNDDQLDKQIREGLNGDIPPPDPDAKRRAIAMARAEFVAEHAQATEKQKEKESQKSPQGFLGWLRLIVGNNADKEGDIGTSTTTNTTKKMKSSDAQLKLTWPAIGRIIAEVPRIKKMLYKLDPTTFPIARSPSPCLAATADAANSGTDVPNATMVRAMMRLLTPKASASPTAP